MVLKGNQETRFANDFLLGYNWSATQNIGGNSSTVTVTLYLKSTASWGYTVGANSQNTTTISINGNKKTFTATSQISAYQTKTLGSHSVVVPHNADGTKTFNITGTHWWSVYYNVYKPMTVSVGQNWSLNTIPRATPISLNKSRVAYGEGVRINLRPAASGFRHTLRWAWDGKSGGIKDGAPNSYDWTVPTSFMNHLTNGATTSWGYIYCDTYSGSSKIGETRARLDTYIPDNIIPSFTSFSITDKNEKINSVLGSKKFVQDLSQIEVEFSGAQGIQGSTIQKYVVSVGGQSFMSSTNIVKVPSNGLKGDVTFTCYVMDNRNRQSNTKTETINFMPYTAPTMELSVARSENGTGNNIIVTRKIMISSLGGVNTWSINGGYKESTNTSSDWISLTTMNATGTTANTTRTDNDNSNKFAGDKTYIIASTITDKFNSYTTTTLLPHAITTLALGKTGLGIGKMHNRGALDVRGESYIEGNIWLKNGTLFLDDIPILKRGDSNTIELDSLGQDLRIGGTNTRYVAIMKPMDVFQLTDYWDRIRVQKDARLIVQGGGKVVFNGSANGGTGVYMNDSGNLFFPGTSTGFSWGLYGGNGNRLLNIQNSGRDHDGISIATDNRSEYMLCRRIYNRTYAGGANVTVTEAGVLGRVTSAKKYKMNIEKMEGYNFNNILKLDGKKWFDKSSVEDSAEYLNQKAELDRRLAEKDLTPGMYNLEMQKLDASYPDKGFVGLNYGLIAEDLEEAGLSEFCLYKRNPDGTQELEGIQYDRLVVPLIEVVKLHDKKIKSLESRLEHLEKLSDIK